MTSTIGQLCTEMAEALNDGTFSKKFTAEKKFREPRERKDINGLVVLTGPVDITKIKTASRLKTERDNLCGIGIYQAVGPDADAKDKSLEAEVEELLELVEEMADYMSLRDMDSGQYLEMSGSPVLDYDALEKHIFKSQILITYRTWHSKSG